LPQLQRRAVQGQDHQQAPRQARRGRGHLHRSPHMTALTLSRAERGYAGLAMIAAPDRLIAATRDGTIEVWSLAELDAAPSVGRAAFLRPTRVFASGLPAIHRLAVHGSLAAVAGAGA